MMAMVRVNIFGRFGCLVTRTVAWSSKVEVIAINDPFIHINYMVYMLQYDSNYDKFNSTVETENEKLVINSKSIAIFQKQNSANIIWRDASAEYVVESTGIFTAMEKAGPYLKGGVKGIIISTPCL